MKLDPEIIACRELFENESNELVLTVKICKPLYVKKGEWLCRVIYDGIKTDEKKIPGYDATQSLYMALEYTRMFLSKNYKELKWIGGEKGDHGFNMIAPRFFGLKFAKKVEKMVTKAIDKENKQLEKKIAVRHAAKKQGWVS